LEVQREIENESKKKQLSQEYDIERRNTEHLFQDPVATKTDYSNQDPFQRRNIEHLLQDLVVRRTDHSSQNPFKKRNTEHYLLQDSVAKRAFKSRSI